MQNGMDGCVDFAGVGGAVVVTSPTVLAGDVALGVALPAVAGAGMVIVCVADLADAGMAFPADLSGAVTVGVTDLAIARAAPLADISIDLGGGQ